MEELRVQLVNCMRYGHTLYIRLGDSACDFQATFNGEDTFPLAVFDRRVVSSLAEYREGSAKSLWGSEHPLAKTLRESDLNQGLFQPRFSHRVRSDSSAMLDGFDVVVCTQHPPEDFRGMLAESLPLQWLQPIKPHPSTVRLKYNHYNQGGRSAVLLSLSL